MNAPPKTFIRVPHEALQQLVSDAGQAAGLPADKADFLAELLTINDLRGVYSHGTQQICAYARLMRDGKLNPNPNPRAVKDSPTHAQYDGDGGLGYFPCRDATLAAIDKAKEHGIAIVGTTNHGHFGAAGIYSRMTLEHDLLTWVTSGHQMGLGQGAPFVTAAGGSPMSYSTPTGDEDPFVLDFGAVHDLYVGESNREAISKLGPSTVFRSVGLGMICQSWGGFLQGVPFGKAPESRVWEGANQGSLLITFRIDLFMDPAEFKANMEAYSNAIHKLEPLVGFDAVYMAGQLEAERERANREAGVLIGDRHRQQMEKLADEFGLTVPW